MVTLELQLLSEKENTFEFFEKATQELIGVVFGDY